MARGPRWVLWAAVLALAGFGALDWGHTHELGQTFLRADPARAINDRQMLALATRIARPVYEDHCAGCHGPTLRGDRSHGTPDLAANAWIYGKDPVEVERTILYGVRSGHPKSRNVTDMPGLVRIGLITESDDGDVVEYLQSLAGQPHDAAVADRGRVIFETRGNCYDCHAGDARGVSDFGAPALTGPHWLYGGDRETQYRSVYFGRHGRCPAWINRLSPLQVRALAIYLVSAGGSG